MVYNIYEVISVDMIYIKNMGNIYMSQYNRKNNNISFNNDGIITKDILRNTINNFDYLNTFLEFDDSMNIYSTEAINLLSPINYDIFIKYLYFKNMDNTYIKEMYLKHIEIFNNYHEPDGSKNNKDDYLNSSLELIDEFKNGNILTNDDVKELFLGYE